MLRLRRISSSSHHLSDELVDHLLSISVGTISLSEGVSLDLESTKWGRELEWSQEVVGLLELWTAGSDFMDQIFNAVDSVLSKFIGND